MNDAKTPPTSQGPRSTDTVLVTGVQPAPAAALKPADVSSAAAIEARKQALRDRLVRTDQSITAADQLVKSLQAQRDQLLKDKAELEGKNAELTTQRDRLLVEKGELEGNLTKITADHASTTRELSELKRVYGDLQGKHKNLVAAHGAAKKANDELTAAHEDLTAKHQNLRALNEGDAAFMDEIDAKMAEYERRLSGIGAKVNTALAKPQQIDETEEQAPIEEGGDYGLGEDPV